jgi:hypothetical protein
MIRSSMPILAMIVALGFAPIAMAQDENSGVAQSEPGRADLGTVTSGNTTIVFAPAGASNIDAARLRTWGEFAQAHPNVAKELAYNSSLMHKESYLSKHPELAAFFEAHPDVSEAMAENPGNFVAIQPRPGE